MRGRALASGLALVTMVALVFPSANLAAAQAECGKRKVTYADLDRGFYLLVTRVGSTEQDYTGSGTPIPGLVMEVSGPDGKKWIVHGPMLSSMFVTKKLDGITWGTDASRLPDSFRIINNDQKLLFELRFMKCA